jgi:LacI family transcriptional regulator
MARKPGKTTIHDIAFELRLNASTVSRALANNPVVSQKTRNLVLAKAKELHYRPNHIAAALRRGRSDILGVIVPAIDRAFFASVIRGIEEKAGEQGYHIMVCQSYDSSLRERTMVETLRRVQVDGILISVAKDGKTDTAFYRKLIDGGLPVQFFDNIPEGIEAPAVVIDDEKGAFDATTHLINSGYRRIAHLCGPQHLHIYRDRYLGYTRALKEAGLPVEDELIVEIDSHFDTSPEIFNSLWKRPNPPDAIFSASDYSAAVGLKAALKLGLRIPEDLAFMGFSNEPFTEIITPQLSSVDQQTLEMGRRSAERLMAVLNNNSTPAKTEPKLVLLPKVIVRESSS